MRQAQTVQAGCALFARWAARFSFALSWRVALLLGLAALVGNASASQESATRGYNWLSAHAASLDATATATVAQARCETATTLLMFDGPSPQVNILLDALASDVESSESLGCLLHLRAAVVQGSVSADAERRRIGHQGWGAYPGFSVPSVLDTGWVSISQISLLHGADRSAVLAWLGSAQAADGSFAINGRADLLATAIVLRAVQREAPSDASAAAIARKAATWLLSKRDTQGHWVGDVGVSAVVLEAVYPYTGADPAVASAVTHWLVARQDADGSWGQDAYRTAVATRAIRRTATPPLDPTRSGLRVKFVDGRTALPLPGVQLALVAAGSAVASGNDGVVQLLDASPGTYQLTAQRAGYAQVSTAATLVPGRMLDLGTIQLLPPSSADRAIVSGTIRAQGSNAPLTGASVTLEPGPMGAITAPDGSYVIPNVVPGTVTLSVRHTGYLSVVATASVGAGQMLNFSPLLSAEAGGAGPTGCRVVGTITEAGTGQPVAGAAVQISGANSAVLETDAAGKYVSPELVPGAVNLMVFKAGYDTVGGTAAVACDRTRPSILDFSPRLYPAGQTPPNANRSSLTGRVLDAATGQPIADAQLVLAAPPEAARTATSAADGTFSFAAIGVPTVSLLVQAQGYEGATIHYALSPLQDLDVGQVRLRRPNVQQLLPDLKVVAVRRETARTDPHSLSLSGAVAVVVANAGTQQAPAGIVTAFHDANGNQRFDAAGDLVLGAGPVPTLAAGATATVTIAVQGVLPYRDATIHVMADAAGELAESNEANNVGKTSDQAQAQPQPAELVPQQKWQWSSSSFQPNSVQVESGILVGPFEDTDGDGKLGPKDVPRVMFVTYTLGASVYEGVLRIVDGRDGTEIRSIYRPGGIPLSGYAGFAAADTDGDGVAEIFLPTLSGQLVSISPTGQVNWVSSGVVGSTSQPYGGGPSIADIDGDGVPEVLYGRFVLNALTGAVKWTGAGVSAGAPIGYHSFATDLLGNGQQHVVVGASAYRADGQLLWEKPALGNGYAAVLKLPGRSGAQIAVVASGYVCLLDSDGSMLWGPVSLGGAPGGAPTIADFDGDGIPDIGVAGTFTYKAFRADGSLLWSVPSNDTSGQTGSSSFDFDGDGVADVVYADERHIRIINGVTGAVRYALDHSNGTAGEQPVVADVDNDGHADFLIASDKYSGGNFVGVRAFQGSGNKWVAARPLWNQYAYSITNINDDLTVPRNPVPSWAAHNTFRLNKRLEADPRAVPDLTVGYLRVGDGGPAGSVLTVRVGNAGGFAVPAGARLAVYSADPSQGPSPAAVEGTATVNAEMLPGQWRDVAIAVPKNLASLNALGRIWVVGDDDGAGRQALADFDRSNNTLAADLPLVAVNLVPVVAASKVVYSATDQAVFTVTVTNAGSFPRETAIRLTIVDTAGAVVDTLTLAPLSVPAGASAAREAVWPVAGTLSGDYQVKADLLSPTDLLYGSASAPFKVVAGDSSPATARLSTDRATYTGAQSVQLSVRVGNNADNEALNDVRTVTEVKAEGGQSVFGRSEVIAQIPAKTQRQFGYALAGSALVPGRYGATTLLVNAAGETLAQADASFHVVGADQSGAGLAGQLQIQPAQVVIGQPIVFGVTVTNNSTIALVNVPLNLRVLDPATGQVLATLTGSLADLPAGQSRPVSFQWPAVGTDGQLLLASATAVVGGRDVALAQGTFRAIGIVQLRAEPQAIVFAPAREGASVNETLTLVSTGSAAARTLTFTLGGANAGQFAVPSGGCTGIASLPPGATCTLTVSYRPQAAGTHVGELRVSYSATEPLLVRLAGEARTAPLSGTLSVEPREVQAGQSLSLAYTVSNPGLVTATAALKLSVQGVQGQELAHWPLGMSVGAGATVAGNQPYTAGPNPQALTAILSQVQGTTTIVLATQGFTVVPAVVPVKVALAAQVKRDARILVLVSCSESQDSHKGHGERSEREEHDEDDDEKRERRAESGTPKPDVRSCLASRVKAASDLLAALGVPHKVVTTEAAFKHEMRCGNYNTYWVSGGAAKLDHWLVKEVREAVWRGDSLVMDGEHDDRNQLLHVAAGVKYRGKLGRSNLTVNIPAGSVFAQGSLPTLGQPPKFDLEGGQRQASFAGPYSATPAIVSNAYGNGRSLLFAFDLMGMIATGAGGQVGQIVDATLAHAASSGPVLTEGDTAAIALSVTNQGTRTVSLQVQGGLPGGTRHVDASPEPESVDGTKAVWDLVLAAGASQEILWRVRGTQAGTWTLPITVHSVPDGTGTLVLQASAQAQLQVTAGSTLLQGALPALHAMQPPTANGRSSKSKAIAAASDALALHNQGKFQDAIVQWAASANAVMAITGTDTKPARDAVALALEATTDGLCETLACLSGSLSLPAQAQLWSTLSLNRAAGNSCAAPARGLDLHLGLSNRRTGEQLLEQEDRNLTLGANQTQQRTATWAVQSPAAQAGDWLDAVLTANWQGHQIELARAATQAVASQSACQPGQPLAASRFLPHGMAEGLFAQGGRETSGGSDRWEWALGTAVPQSGKSEVDHMEWESGKTYQWQLQINSSGQASFNVKEGGRKVAGESFSGGRLKLGNALKLAVQAAGDVGGASIAATLTRLDGQATDTAVATDGAGQERSRAIFQPTLANGFSAEGTVKLTFAGSAPPAGARVQMSVQTGTASCQ